MSLSIPPQITVPFANAGLKVAIPATSNNVTGRAGYDQGFPPINMTPKVAGGIPPFGTDMNGIMYETTQGLQFLEAGNGFVYNSVYATAIGGYRPGARVLRTDGRGYWLNTIDGNTVDPESAGGAAAGWVPDFTNGIAAVTMTNANVTLTPLQYGRPIIVISGTLTANVNLIFPNIAAQWIVLNNTTGSFTITCRTAAGSGVPATSGIIVVGDGTNIYTASNIADASTTFAGKIQIATAIQAQAWSSLTLAMTPGNLAQSFAGANQTLSANGYQRLPGGVIIQWGTTGSIASNASSGTITFPIAFPSNATYVNYIGNAPVTGGANTNPTLATKTTSNFSFVNAYLSAVAFNWFAVGY